MRLGTSAFDTSPQHMLRLLAEAAKARGHDVLPPFDPKDQELCRHIDEQRDRLVMLVGLSTIDAEARVIAACAKKQVPAYAVADTWGTLQRPWLKAPGVNPVSQLSGAFAAFPDDVRTARDFGHKNVRYAGPPPHWVEKLENMCNAQSLADRLRKKTGSAASDPFSPADRLLYIAGSKRPPRETHAFWKEALVAAQEHGFVTRFQRHPGEETLYMDEARERAALESTGVQLAREITEGEKLQAKNFTDEELAELAEIVFYTGGGPTGSIVAAMRRKRLLYAHDPRMAKQVEGASGWFVADRNAAHIVRSPEEVRAGITHLLSGSGASAQQKVQEVHFPVLNATKEEAAAEVIQALEEAVRE